MPTGKNNLSSEAICVIIESCAKHGVAELKFQDLHVKFGKSAIQELGPQNSNSPEAEISEEQHEEQTAHAIEKDEVDLREEQLEELFLTDPMAAEEMLRNGEFEDADEFGDE